MATSEEQSNAGSAINWHHISFGPYKYKDILIVDLTQGVNEHGRLYIRCVLNEIPADQASNQGYVQTTQEYSPVFLTYIDQSGTKQYLFQGIVTNIKQSIIAGLAYLDIEAFTFSYLLDVKKRNRSFQREQEPYSYVFQRINSLAREYVPGLKDDVVKATGNQDTQTTGRLIIQYQETDWCLLKRIASFFNISLMVDVTLNSPKVYFGLPPAPISKDGKKEKPAELKVSTYQIRRDTGNYASSSSNSRKNSGIIVSENDFTYCEVESLEVLKLGQQVNFQGLSWYIKNIHTHMDKGIVKNIYILATEKGLMQDDLYNENLAGISLSGIVKSIAKDQVKVHITEIDAEWDSGATWWFPYTTIYSSPDGSGFYCMPEVNDNVRIYFQNKEEVQSVAVSSVNMTPSQRGKREDPNTKILSTVHGKQVVLTPSGIQIIANENLLMTLSDEGGVSIKSDKKIKMEAKDAIEITSTTSKIIAFGKEEVNLSQGGGKVVIKEDITVSGQKVRIQP